MPGNCIILVVSNPEHFLFDDKDERFVVVGVDIAHLNRRFLFLSYPLALGVEQLDFHVRICFLGEIAAHFCFSKLL